MISVWWLFVAFLVGACCGMFLAALIMVHKDDD